MPAIKAYQNNEITLTNGFYKSELSYVDIYLKSGSTDPVIWMGFCSELAVTTLQGPNNKYVKMRALSVTQDAGYKGSRWRVLQSGEYVLCWLCPFNFSYQGVYTICDSTGCPIVLGAPRLAMTG